MKKKILVIDDDKELSEELAGILKDEGYEVQTAFDGKQGERMVRKSRYDIILIDFKMPGMTGIELFRKFRLSSHSRVLFISGRPFLNKLIKEEGLSQMVSGWLQKPFEVEKLLQKIKD